MKNCASSGEGLDSQSCRGHCVNSANNLNSLEMFTNVIKYGEWFYGVKNKNLFGIQLE
jgi:hypothetical protein